MAGNQSKRQVIRKGSIISSYNHPILIFVRGLPGSGKSYLADQLRQKLGANDVVMLDPDKTDYSSQKYLNHVAQATAAGVDPKLHAYRFLRAQAYEGIAANKIIIWNQPFTNLEIFNKMTVNLRLQAEEHNVQLPILVVEVAIDPAIAKKRIAERKQQGGHGPSTATFERFVGDYKSFAEEGYHTVTVQGSDDVAASIEKVLQSLSTLTQNKNNS